MNGKKIKSIFIIINNDDHKNDFNYWIPVGRTNDVSRVLTPQSILNFHSLFYGPCFSAISIHPKQFFHWMGTEMRKNNRKSNVGDGNSCSAAFEEMAAKERRMKLIISSVILSSYTAFLSDILLHEIYFPN